MNPLFAHAAIGVLEDQIRWQCLDCDLQFEMAYPPVCPQCAQSKLEDHWEKIRQQQQQERERKERERQDLQRERKERERQDLQRGRKLVALLKRHGIRPENNCIIGYMCHIWKNRPDATLLTFFKHYCYWERRIGEWHIARDQALWEMHQPILAMRNAGMSYRAIGSQVGLSCERVRQIIEKERRRRKVHGHWRSPVERWLNDRDDIGKLYKKLMKAAPRLEKRRQMQPLWMYELEEAA